MLPFLRGYSFVLTLALATAAFSQDRRPLIINGTPTDDFAAVGIVGELGVGGFCTGTLISPNHVLTAAHCAEAILSVGNGQTGTFTVGDRTYVTSSIEVHPTYDNLIFTDDLAILVLSEPVQDISPMDLDLVPSELGDEVTIVGFGGQGTPEGGTDGSFGEKLVGTTVIDSVSNTELSWLFDDPAHSNPAPGDSGGPVIQTRDGVSFLAGVVSSGIRADAGLGDVTFCMSVVGYGEWIDETVLFTTIDTGSPADPDPGPQDPGGEDPVPADPEVPVECPQQVEAAAESPGDGQTEVLTEDGVDPADEVEPADDGGPGFEGGAAEAIVQAGQAVVELDRQRSRAKKLNPRRRQNRRNVGTNRSRVPVTSPNRNDKSKVGSGRRLSWK